MAAKGRVNAARRLRGWASPADLRVGKRRRDWLSARRKPIVRRWFSFHSAAL